ncbi:MAG TPA: hypothetical protein PKA42_03110 [Candidatus Paceibacterota bacterium]|nr:hypothetical protein [Candidatus Paceibacterota bacterium]HMO83134.1 hypothetical protein [Candidatus Paceibacterota bacterium]
MSKESNVNPECIAPPGKFRVMGAWPGRRGKSGEFFEPTDFDTIAQAKAFALSLNTGFEEREETAYFFIFDDRGKKVTG